LGHKKEKEKEKRSVAVAMPGGLGGSTGAW